MDKFMKKTQLAKVHLTFLGSRSGVSDSTTPWTVAHQAPLSMEFSRQEYWSGLLFLSPGDLPDPGIKTESLALQVDSSPTEPLEELIFKDNINI